MKVALIAALLVGLWTVPATAAAPAGKYHVLGMSRSGALLLDRSTARWWYGYRRVSNVLILPEPVPYAGLMLQRIDVAMDWDCEARQYRVYLRIWRTLGGRYVRSRRVREPWVIAGRKSDADLARRLVCAAEQPVHVESFADLESAEALYFGRLERGELAEGTAMISQARGP